MRGRLMLVGLVTVVTAGGLVGPVSAAPAPPRVVIGKGTTTCRLEAGAN